MAIPNPNPNIADGIKSDNKTYSSNKIESLIKTATELPIPEAGDSGKVLTVNSDGDGYELDFAGHDLIDDVTASDSTVYSSNKVDTLLDKIIEKVTGVTFGTKIDTTNSILKVYKIGKVCWIYAYIALSDSISDGYALITGLPARSGARSANTIPIMVGNLYFNATVNPKACYVDASGNLEISLNASLTTSDYILINACYELA